MNLPLTPNTLFMATGGLFLLNAFWQFIRLWRLSVNGIRTEALVTDLVEISNAHGPRIFFPVLEYRTQDGETITLRSYVGDRKDKHQVGDKVPIVYDADKPRKFLLDTGMDKYWKVVGSVIAGVVFLVVGIFRLI